MEAEAPNAALDDEIEPARAMLVRVGDTALAVPLGTVREVVRARPATRLPGAPRWVTGLVAIRGAAVPVADLGRRADDAAAEAPWLVVVEARGRRAALGVSAVVGVHVVGDATSDAALPAGGSVRLLEQGAGRALSASVAAHVLDVAAVLEELFDGD